MAVIGIYEYTKIILKMSRKTQKRTNKMVTVALLSKVETLKFMDGFF